MNIKEIATQTREEGVNEMSLDILAELLDYSMQESSNHVSPEITALVAAYKLGFESSESYGKE